MNDRFEKDARLGEDIRLLGRILGDTIRAYEGEAAFAMVEDIRQLAVAARRLEDTAAAERLSKVLDALSAAEAVMVIRAVVFDIGGDIIIPGRQITRFLKPCVMGGALADDPKAIGAAIGQDLAVEVTEPEIEIDRIGAKNHRQPFRNMLNG